MKNMRVFNKIMSIVLAVVMVLSMLPMSVFATEATQTEVDVGEQTAAVETTAADEGSEETPTEGYILTILNADGSEGMTIDGTKSASEFSLKSAIEDARTYPEHAFLFGLTTPCTYVVEMYEDSTEDESFEIGSDVTVNGNGYSIVCAEGVTVTNNGTLNNATIVETEPAVLEVATLAELTAALAADSDLPIVITAQIEIPASETVTLDLNGKTVTGTDNNTSGNFYLIDNRGTLTVKDSGSTGKITLTAENERNWTASSVVIANNPGGKLTVESGTIEHLGGTSMAYAIDNLTNGTGTYAETVITGGTVTSAYIGVRQFLNGVEAQNILTINGGTVTGGNSAIYFQSPNANANTGTLTISENAAIGKRIYLGITSGTTEWPVEISVAAAALAEGVEIVHDPIPEGYELKLTDDVYGVVEVTYVAEVNGVGYATLEEAFAAAAEGDTITLLADATPALTSQRAITKAAVIDLGGKTLTLTEDDLYFGTTTFKNGSIVVDPSVRPSTAVFWMFANQTLTFDNVKLTATGVTGTYLIGLDGNNSDLNLINGSEIIVENTTALDLDIICVNASTGNDILIADSKVSVTNLDGRVFFRGNYTVSGTSDIDLSGITKAGFRIEAGQTLSIEDTATVDIVGEPRDGGIHLTDVTAAYTKADTATVNATVNAPTPAYVAEINGVGYATLEEAFAAAAEGDTITLLSDATVAATTNINKSITIDGDGHNLTQAADFAANGANVVLDIFGNATVTFKNLTFDGIKNVGVMRTVDASVVIDNCVVQNCEQTVAQGLLRLACGNATITNSKFLNNDCTMVVSFGFDAAYDTDVLLINGCTFQGNTCGETAVVYFADGDSATVSNTKFVENEVTSAGNAATLYMGWGEGFAVSGCLFEGNTVTSTHASSKRVASAVFCDGCTVTGNAFIDNTATRDGAAMPTVAVAAYYGAADVSGNYWDGDKPNYTVEYTRNPVDNSSYYTAYANENGEVTLENKVDVAARIGTTVYASLTEALAAAKAGETVVLMADAEISSTINIQKGITLDGNGKTIKAAADFTGVSAVMIGESGWSFGSTAITIKNTTFTGFETSHGVLRIQGVSADVTNCTFTGNTQTGTGFGIVNYNFAAGTVSGCTFTENTCAEVVDINSQPASTYVPSEAEVFTVKNNTFADNTVTSTAVVYYAKGAGVTFSENTFTENTMTTTGNAGVLYFSEGANSAVTGNLFQDNSIANAAPRSGVLLLESGITVTDNAFVGNVLNAEADYMATVLNKADAGTPAIDLSGNYWGGGEPDYATVKGAPTTVEDYYTTYEDGTLGGLTEIATPVAKIGDVEYTSLEAAAAAAQAGDEIVLIADATLSAELTLPAGIILNGGGYQINGTIYAGGDLTIANHAKVTAFGFKYAGDALTIGEGACLEITGSGRMTVGYGCQFNITGTITDAKTADKSQIQPSLIIPGGASITGGSGVTFNVTNAYVKIGSTTSKNSVADGTFTLNFTNSIAEFTNQFTLAEPTNSKTPTFVMNVKDSVMTTATKFIVAAPDSTVTIDNSTVTLGTYFRNSGEMTLTNGSVLTGKTIQFGENGGNDGITTVDNSTFTITASSAGHALDGKETGKLIVVNGGTANVDYITNSAVEVDPYSTFTTTQMLGNSSLTVKVASQAELQAALDNCAPGTTIQLTEGVSYGVVYLRPVAGNENTVTDCDYLVYRNEMLRKVEDLTIKGANGATIDAIVAEAGHIEGSTGYMVSIHNLVIDSVEFTDKHTNAPHSYAAPVFFDLSYVDIDGLTVQNCQLIGENDKMNLVYIYSSGAVAFDEVAENITITGNTVEGIARLCELRQTENLTITDNIIKNTAGNQNAIQLSTNAGTYSGTVTITGNRAENIGGRIIRMAGVGESTVVISNNTVTGYTGTDADFIKADGIAEGNANVRVENNKFDGEVMNAVIDNGVAKVEKPVYLAKMGGVQYKTVADALAAAQTANLTDVVITLIGETTKDSAVALEDCFDLYQETAFDSVTFKQADATKVYYIAGLYTGSRTNGGTFVFDGVNVVVTDQYIFEGNVKLTNNSMVKSVAEANCFQYYSTTTVEPGSKLYGVIDDFRGGDVIVDGGKTDGTYNDEADMQDAILTVSWSGDSLTLKNGAYVKVNSANEVGRLTVATGAALNVYASKLDSWEWIDVSGTGTLNTDLGSQITTKKITGNGKIVIDATGFDGESVQVITADMSEFTGTITVTDGYEYAITETGIVVTEKVGLSGKGTEAEPYLIKTLADLILFRDSVNAGETKYNAPGVYVALDADIDMAGTDWSVNIGDDCNATFDGIFDGKGHTISNLTATETAAKADGYVCTGLFGAIYGSAVIKNLTIENVAINTGDFTGNNAAAVVGFAYSCTGSVENVKVTGDIKINAKNVTGTGAIVGYAYYGELTVKDCSVVGNDGSYITGAAYVGGVIGYASTNSNVSGNTVENVAITAQCCVGGVAGIMLNNGKAEGNTVKNVTLTATHENWQNSAAAVVGAISGGTITVSGTTVENVNTAALVGANMTEEHPSAPVEKVEAAIGNTYYGTLEAAINAAKGQTITLLVPYVVEAGETVTLDLKGQTVVMEKAEKVTANHAMILNKGNLTIKDSVGGGKLTYQYTGENLGVTYAVTTITSNPGSTLTVEGGTIENLTYDNSVIAYAIDGLTNGGLGDVTVNINGGTIIGLRQAVRIFANSTTNTGTLNITGGDITGRVIVQNANANANKAVLEITGGTFNANSYKTEVLYVGGSNGAGMAIDATVSGGTFKGEVASSVPNGFITDGTFKSDVTAFCAEGYTCEQNADGTWGVSEVELAEFRGAAVDMGNTLNMNFYISKNNFNGEGYYVEMISGDTTKTVEMADWLASGSDYVFIYDGLAAKQMCDEIKVTVYDADGKQVSKTWTDSIRAYVDRMWDKQTGDEIRTLFVDMLNYGAAAQGHFTYNTDDLANSWLTEEQQDYATVRVECLNTRVKTDNCIGTAFQLESNISMNLYFSGVTSDMYAEVTFTHHNEIEQTKVRIEGTEFNRDGSNTVITVDEIVVADGRQPVTCTVFDADGNEVASVTDSLESYVSRMGGSYPWLYEVMKFSDSAYNFLH